ncbi:MAG: hypothetical protein HYZ26_12215 [Chloroflexi bacterium]|nr:hypothetical protein [Chloroflexota bacterium]
MTGRNRPQPNLLRRVSPLPIGLAMLLLAACAPEALATPPAADPSAFPPTPVAESPILESTPAVGQPGEGETGEVSEPVTVEEWLAAYPDANPVFVNAAWPEKYAAWAKDWLHLTEEQRWELHQFTVALRDRYFEQLGLEPPALKGISPELTSMAEMMWLVQTHPEITAQIYAEGNYPTILTPWERELLKMQPVFVRWSEISNNRPFYYGTDDGAFLTYEQKFEGFNGFPRLHAYRADGIYEFFDYPFPDNPDIFFAVQGMVSPRSTPQDSPNIVFTGWVGHFDDIIIRSGDTVIGGPFGESARIYPLPEGVEINLGPTVFASGKPVTRQDLLNLIGANITFGAIERFDATLPDGRKLTVSRFIDPITGYELIVDIGGFKIVPTNASPWPVEEE